MYVNGHPYSLCVSLCRDRRTSATMEDDYSSSDESQEDEQDYCKGTVAFLRLSEKS